MSSFLVSIHSAHAQDIRWVRQFGSSGVNDAAFDVAVDKSGHIYTVGMVFFALPGQTALGPFDGFLRKYDSNGTEEWTRQFGTFDSESANGVAVAESQDIYVAGNTVGSLSGQTSAGAADAFVRKYDTGGTAVWTRQFGSPSNDVANKIEVAVSDDIYVVGSTDGSLPDQTSSGGRDAYVRKYNSSGMELWTRQFGTSSEDRAEDVGVDESENAYVVGFTDGSLPGQTSSGGRDAYIRKYDTSGTELWTRQFGTPSIDWAVTVAVDGSGNVYVAGFEDGTLPGQTSAGNRDVFIRKYNTNGVELWTRQFGSSLIDGARGLAVEKGGDVYVAGFTGGELPGEEALGGLDAFVRRYDTDGTEVWTFQFGTSTREGIFGVASGGSNEVYVSGQTDGTFPGESSAGADDAYLARLDQETSAIPALSLRGVAIFTLLLLFVRSIFAGRWRSP